MITENALLDKKWITALCGGGSSLVSYSNVNGALKFLTQIFSVLRIRVLGSKSLVARNYLNRILSMVDIYLGA